MKIVFLVLVCLFMVLTAQAKDNMVDNEQVSGQIKSCLVDLYIAQQKYFEYNATYTASVKELSITEKPACKGIQISFEIANKETFVLVGKSSGRQWTLDESKSLTQIH